MMADPHCRIGKVRLKGNRSVAKRLPLKLIKTSMQLSEEIERAKTKPSVTDKREGRA